MTKPKKILAIGGASIGGLIAVAVIASVIIVQTSWFSNFVRNKIISTVETSTGGTVEIGSFHFDPWHLTVTIRNFVLHGTEPKTADPLARIALLEVHLKLFSGIAHAVDLAYVGIEQPKVNLIVYPDGKTNVPQPKIQKQSSNSNGLQTIVDLKIGEFLIKNGLVQYAQQKSSFSGRGENLHALLNYNSVKPSYSGSLTIDPLILTEGSRPPLNVRVNLPVTIEGDGLKLANATFATGESKIGITGSLQNMKNPLIEAQLNANVSLPELQRSLDLPIDANAAGAPKTLTADISAHVNSKDNLVQLQSAHLALGKTTMQASGNLRDPANPNSAVQFNADLALGELAKLMKGSTLRANGAVLLNGNAKLDANNNYNVNGTVNSRDVSIQSGTTKLSNVSLYTPFHADPYLISLDGLKLNAVGGSLAAKVFIEKMQQFSVEGTLHNFSIPVLAAAATGKHLGYDGNLNGALKAKGDLKAKGTSGLVAQAALTIAPGRNGVPVSGRIRADYDGARDAVDLHDSFLSFPHSRLDLSGTLDKELNVDLVSHGLNDFLPAANFGAKQPVASLPVTLGPGGTARVQARITGNLSAPHIASHVALNHFSVEQRPFDALALDLAASPSQAVIQNGSLSRNSLRTTFDASIGLRKWNPTPRSPLTANLAMHNASVSDLLALAGQSSIPASGELSADVHIHGTYGDPLGSATLQAVNGSVYQQPFDKLFAQVNLADRLITLQPLEITSDAGNVTVNARFEHPADSFTVGSAHVRIATSSPIQLAKLRELQQKSPGTAGAIQLTADAALTLRDVKQKTVVDIESVNADLAARHLVVQNQNAGDLTLAAHTANKNVTYQLASDLAGSQIKVDGQTLLAADYPTTATASIRNLSLQKALSIAGQGGLPVRGDLSADAHVSGTVKAPLADLQFSLNGADVYQEKINRLSGRVHYTDTLVEIPSLDLDTPAGGLTLSASFSHPSGNFNSGALKLKADSTDIQLAKIEHIHQSQPTLIGTLHLAADLSANLREHQNARQVLLSRLNANVSAEALHLHGRPLGHAELLATTHGSNLDFRLDSDLAQSQVHASGQSQLSGDYQTRANLTFTNIRYANIAPFISSEPSVKPAFDALVEGEGSLNGPVMNPNLLAARLRLNQLQLTSTPTSSGFGAPARTASIANQGPIIISYNHSVVNFQQFHLAGHGTTVNLSGTVSPQNTAAPIDLNLDAHLDLSMLQDVSRDIYSSGKITANAAIHGTFAQPLVNGRVVLANANLNYAEAPNGLSNGNGVILLQGTSATIQSLTGESGGGKISVTGFAGLTGNALTYNVKAAANRVRVRYSGISVTSNANIALIGNSNRSLVSGNVTIQRIAYNTSSDAGSLLSSFASTPPSTPNAPSPFLEGMRLNIHILTAPDLRVATTYADKLSVEANLTLRGTAANPGMLGRVAITDGQLAFFGNTYTVNTGTINFYSPTSIQPVINVSLETLAQGVDVTLGVSGPMNNLQLSYRSDPPLTFEQIVQLLATNTTPNDPNIVANQPPSPQQSFTQMGESAVLGQAVANPLASRVQRVFGLSQFKIDPSVAGNNGQPSARVTLQQKIANNITFTYITDVTQTNDEIIRVQWDLTPKFSAVGLRDYNGDVSLQFSYKFKVR